MWLVCGSYVVVHGFLGQLPETFIPQSALASVTNIVLFISMFSFLQEEEMRYRVKWSREPGKPTLLVILAKGNNLQSHLVNKLCTKSIIRART